MEKPTSSDAAPVISAEQLRRAREFRATPCGVFASISRHMKRQELLETAHLTPEEEEKRRMQQWLLNDLATGSTYRHDNIF